MRRWTVALPLLVVCWAGCRRGETPNDPEPKTDPSSSHEGGSEGGADPTASLHYSDVPSPEEPKGPRPRPKTEEVTTRKGADVAVAVGNPEGAAAFLVDFVAKNPKDANARFQLARAQRLTGKWPEAMATLVPLAKHKDKAIVTKSLRRRADLAMRLGKMADAHKLLEQARKTDPAELANKGAMLWLYVQTGRNMDPEGRALTDALYGAYGDDRVKSAEDHLATARATLAEETGAGYKDANLVLGDAERLMDPKSELADDILMLRAEMFRQKYNADEASNTLGLLLERDPWHPDALALLARVKVNSLALASASRAAEEALLVDPGHPDAHAVLARIALIEGRREEAKRRIDAHVLSRSPHHREGLMVKAGLAVFEGDTKAYAAIEKQVLAHNSRDWLFYTALADVLGFLHLYPEADVVLSKAPESLRSHAHMRSAYGLNALRLGKETPAREAIDKAYKKDRFNERTLNTITLYKERIEPHYTDVKTGDLTVRMPSKHAELVGPHYQEAIARARRSLDKAYGAHPSPMRIEIFETQEDFSIRTVGVPSLGAVGVCFGPVITALGPYRGILNFDQVIYHEIAHAYAIELSKGRVPRWFTEGLSEWESEVADPSWARENARLLLEAKRRGKTRKLRELELAFLRAESPIMMEVAYSTATYAVRYLGETYGRPKLITMLKGYATGQSTDELMRKHLGKSSEQVEKEFDAWFDKELARRFSGWVPNATVDAHAVVTERGAETKGDERDRLFHEGLELAKAGKMKEARPKFETLIKKGGDGFAARYALGRALMKSDKKAAISQLEKARTFHIESVDTLVELASLARDLDDITMEMGYLEEALRIDNMALDPAARMLMLTAVTGDKRHAFALERSLAIAPLHPIVLAAQARRLAAKKNPKRAKQLLEGAQEILAGSEGKGPTDTYVMLALAADATGDAALAKEMAKHALSGGPLYKQAKTKMEKLAK